MGYLVQRLTRSVLVICGVLLFVFVLLRVAPGDPVLLILGQNPSIEAEQQLRQSLGLDRAIPIQLARFIGNAVQGELGSSLVYQRPANDLVLEALPATLILTGAAFALSVLIAVPAGVFAALGRNRWSDWIVRATVLLSQALPTFWIGIMLIFFFAVQLGWFPTSGSGSWGHLVLPAITLSLHQWALIARLVRSGMLDVLEQDYIRTAHSKGLAPHVVVIRHAFRNTLLPVVTVLALQLSSMLSGAVVTEAVFAWPGIGTLAINAILARDYPLIQAIVLISAICVVALNLLADLSYFALDPRVRG